MLEKCEDRSLLATLGIGPTGLHVAEGASATLQATLSQASTQPVTFQFRTVAGTALENTDYVGVTSQSVTIPPGALFANISIQALQDIVMESGETFSVQLLSATGATLNPAATSTTVTIDNVQGGSGGGGSGPLVVALSLPSHVNEGELFTLTGTLTNAGYYQISGTINWGGTAGVGSNTFSVATNPNGSFTVSYRYVDDGPSPGNGTTLDVQAITLSGTATPMSPGGSTLSVTGNASTTIHNLAPAPVFDVYNQSPLGGPWWVASGTFQDVGLTDKGTLTIDWGDGSAPFTQADLTVGNTFSQTHQYPPAGQSYTITMTITDDDTGSASYSEAFSLYMLDLDNDADNSGAINDLDDAIEAILPGRYITVNADDDNEDEIPDKDQVGPISGEDDLEPLLIRWQAASRADINNYAGYLLTLSIDSYVSENPVAKLWTTADKTGEILLGNSSNGYMKVWAIGQDIIPSTLYLEALTTGPLTPRLHLRSPGGTSLEQDVVVFTARPADTDVNLIIYDGQSGKEVPEADEDVTGAVTVANLNDTDADSTVSNGNSKRDFEDPDGVVENRTGADKHGRNEVDLMKLQVKRPVAYSPGTFADLWLIPPGRVRLWNESTKLTPAANYDPIEGHVALSWSAGEQTKEFWVEIISKSDSVGDVRIDFAYGGKTDTVVATGIWAVRTDQEFDDHTWNDLAGTVWRTDMDVAVGERVQKYDGTGVKPTTDVNLTAKVRNVILFQFTVYPNDVQRKIDRVRFDITRQIEAKSWKEKNSGIDPPEDIEGFPDEWELPNDDKHDKDESDSPNLDGRMYSMDSPGFDFPSGGRTEFFKYYQQANYFEYMRVTFKEQSRPWGEVKVIGSQCSESVDWHTILTTNQDSNDQWIRTVGGVNEIKRGHIVIGNMP